MRYFILKDNGQLEFGKKKNFDKGIVNKITIYDLKNCAMREKLKSLQLTFINAQN
jgi:hypothetical protein